GHGTVDAPAPLAPPARSSLYSASVAALSGLSGRCHSVTDVQVHSLGGEVGAPFGRAHGESVPSIAERRSDCAASIIPAHHVRFRLRPTAITSSHEAANFRTRAMAASARSRSALSWSMSDG